MSEDTQKTMPRKGDPIEIPVPEKVIVLRDFVTVANAAEQGFTITHHYSSDEEE